MSPTVTSTKRVTVLPTSDPSKQSPVAVYIHTPFCPHKCGYCDFNSYAMQGEIMRRTTDAMLQEIRNSPWKGRPAKTIFFGGGTPTYLPTEQLTELLAATIESHPPVPDCEITSEANPGTTDAEKFAAMRAAGFNRISIGAQSFQPDELNVLERIHGPDEIASAVQTARNAGFENINLDLMFALPKQVRTIWQQNLDQAIALAPDHLSLYCLTIEPNTKFFKLFQRGQLTQPGEDAQAELMSWTEEYVRSAGYDQYEISNYAKPGKECEHNLCYWNCEEYVGYGPGAVGALVGTIDGGQESRFRTANLKGPEVYCTAIESGQPLGFEWEALDDATLRTEKIMLGLRLCQGAEIADHCDPKQVDRLVEKGWLEVSGTTLRLTPSGRLFHNEAVVQLI